MATTNAYQRLKADKYAIEDPNQGNEDPDQNQDAAEDDENYDDDQFEESMAKTGN